VADNDGANSMLRFWLKREGDGMKHCQKMKQRNQSRLGSMGRKHDTAWRRRSEERWHQGGEGEKMTLVGLAQILLDQKIKKTHMIDSAATNGW
jgi:hypothetical protein